MTSFFKSVVQSAPDLIFGAKKAFLADKKSDKLDLMVGVFMSQGKTKPDIFRAVKEAEKQLCEVEATKDYLSMAGDSEYLRVTSEYVFGKSVNQKKLCGIQTPGGTSAISIGLSFIKDTITDIIYLSNPTWPNHTKIAKHLGFQVRSYPYFNMVTKTFEKEAFFNTLRDMPKKSCLLLQACAHNPTGFDLPFDVIKEVSAIAKEKQLVLFLDSAYQGLADGCEKDAKAMRYFLNEGHEIFVSHSFSKSLGLYGERLGALYVVTNKGHDEVQSQLEFKVRVNYSNPPRHPSEVVKLIFSNRNLYKLWQDELEEKREHLFWVKKQLVKECRDRFDLDMSYLDNAKGMWGLLPLDKNGVEQLKKKAGIYLIGNGRVNLSALHEPTLKVLYNGLEKVEHLFI